MSILQVANVHFTSTGDSRIDIDSGNNLIRIITQGGGVVIPSGTNAQRPVSNVTGTLRYNTDIADFEVYSGSTTDWKRITGARGGSTDKIFWENGINVTANYTITTGYNAGTFGPITINDNIVVTIPDGSSWTVT